MSKILLVLVLLLAGCGSTDIVAGDYARDCQRDGDCVAIVAGDVCECGEHCGAINARDFDRYEDDVDSLGGCGFSVAPACGDRDPFVLCRSKGAFCISGSCQIGTAL